MNEFEKIVTSVNVPEKPDKMFAAALILSGEMMKKDENNNETLALLSKIAIDTFKSMKKTEVSRNAFTKPLNREQRRKLKKGK